jgi:hypothetical protein
MVRNRPAGHALAPDLPPSGRLLSARLNRHQGWRSLGANTLKILTPLAASGACCVAGYIYGAAKADVWHHARNDLFAYPEAHSGGVVFV